MVDVLAFGAHPDDVELGCAGTMLRLVDAGFTTAVVDLTAGERGSRGSAAVRAREAEQASTLMGLAERETLDFPDTELVASLELRRAVAEAVRRHRPRIVLAPLPDDLHPDHAAAGRAVREAWYPSGMKNLAAAGEPHRPVRLFHYFMHDEAPAAVVVDVTDVWDRRIEVAKCFASQLHRPEATGDDPPGPEDRAFATLVARSDFLPRLEARARVWGRRAGVEFGEPLVVQGSLAVTDVGALFGGPQI